MEVRKISVMKQKNVASNLHISPPPPFLKAGKRGLNGCKQTEQAYLDERIWRLTTCFFF